MILTIGLETAEYCTVFNYGTPIPHKGVKFKDREFIKGPGIKLAETFMLPGEIRGGLKKSRFFLHGQLKDIIGPPSE